MQLIHAMQNKSTDKHSAGIKTLIWIYNGEIKMKHESFRCPHQNNFENENNLHNQLNIYFKHISPPTS